MSLDKSKLGERIRLIRQEKGLTMEEFGRLVLGAKKSSVSQWENNLAVPNSARLKEIAKIGRISVEELLSETQDVKVKTTIVHSKTLGNKYIVYGTMEFIAKNSCFMDFTGHIRDEFAAFGGKSGKYNCRLFASNYKGGFELGKFLFQLPTESLVKVIDSVEQSISKSLERQNIPISSVEFDYIQYLHHYYKINSGLCKIHIVSISIGELTQEEATGSGSEEELEKVVSYLGFGSLTIDDMTFEIECVTFCIEGSEQTSTTISLLSVRDAIVLNSKYSKMELLQIEYDLTGKVKLILGKKGILVNFFSFDYSIDEAKSAEEYYKNKDKPL